MWIQWTVFIILDPDVYYSSTYFEKYSDLKTPILSRKPGLSNIFNKNFTAVQTGSPIRKKSAAMLGGMKMLLTSQFGKNNPEQDENRLNNNPQTLHVEQIIPKDPELQITPRGTPRSTPKLTPKFQHSPIRALTPEARIANSNLLASLDKSILQIRDWLTLLEDMLEKEKVDLSDVGHIYYMLERQRVSWSFVF